jgi:ankyrin repeat protein
MAYIGNLASLCEAIVDGDLDRVEEWLAQDDANPNQRDHTGRTALHLAVICSTPQIVRCLVKHGCRLVARLADGRTALHLAAARGDIPILKIIMEKSEANEAEEEMKEIRRKGAKTKKEPPFPDPTNNGELDHSDEGELVDDDGSRDGVQSMATGSFVKVDHGKPETEGENLPEDDNMDEPDFYDVNVLAWDTKVSPLHLAIVNGHTEAVKELCQTFGADALLPVKLLHDFNKVSIDLRLFYVCENRLVLSIADIYLRLRELRFSLWCLRYLFPWTKQRKWLWLCSKSELHLLKQISTASLLSTIMFTKVSMQC